MSFVSYAQNGEDVLLNRVFGGRATGFYVDVGAYHPVNGSVTKAFYDRGWAGINVEPGSVFDELAAARPRDVNLRMAVLDRSGTVAFAENAADPGTSRVMEDDDAPGEPVREVPCDTLDAIVRRHSGGRPVDFLKVDAEGAERAIVASTDWRRFRPQVLVFEATYPWSNVLSNAEWEPGLLEAGYVRVFFDGINCYYVPEEELPVLERHFRVPVNVLDGVMPHAMVEAGQKAQEAQATLGAQLAATAGALRAAEDETARLRASVALLDAESARLQDLVRSGDANVASLQAALEEAGTRSGNLRAAADAEVARLQQLLTAAEAESARLVQRLAAADAEGGRIGAALAAAEGEIARIQGLLTVAEAGGARIGAASAEASAEIDRLRARLTASDAEAQRLRDALVGARTEQVRLQADLATITAERVRPTHGQNDEDVERRLRNALEATAAEREALAALMRDIQASRTPQPEHAPALGSPSLWRSAGVRRVVGSVYRMVRPVVRPALHRFRTFMTAPQSHAVQALQEELLRLRGFVAISGSSSAATPALAPPVQQPATPIVIQDPAVLEEARRLVSRVDHLAAEMERALLTLAMEAGSRVPDRASPELSRPESSAPEHVPIGAQETNDLSRSDVTAPDRATVTTMLLLPNGRSAEIEVAAGDLSVGAALVASGGDWEPHVRAFLSRRVGPDWTCLDIGANVGAHALSLATLVRDGRVVGFEADPANHALLCRNAAALPEPKGRIDALHLALWDKAGMVAIGGADELAGCSFVGATDGSDAERALREVVDASALPDAALHARWSRVRAVRLDDWVAEERLERLDFIKLDVEGAEANVVRGADATLRRLRPILLVEYNPACAAAYFGQPPDALFGELASRFDAIHALEPDGSITLLDGWDALRFRLASGRGWEDLVCSPAGAVAS